MVEGRPISDWTGKKVGKKGSAKKKRINNKIMTCVDSVIFSLQPYAFLNFVEIIVIRRC